MRMAIAPNISADIKYPPWLKLKGKANTPDPTKALNRFTTVSL